jgi:peroxiredoxin family protein
VKRALVIFLSGAGWPARYQAISLAATAAALGDEVTLALAFEPLVALLDGWLDEGAPATAGEARVPPLSATLAEVRRELGVRVVACETAVRLAGVPVERARAALDALEPITSQWRRAQSGRAVAY